FGWLFGAPNILKLKQTRNIEGLLKALRYKEVETRCQAAEAVCEVFGATRRSLDKKTVDALLDALLTVVNDQHEITEVRQTAAMALAKIGNTGWSLLDKKTVDALLTVVNDQ